jgi:hypothetical protein
MEFRYQPLNPNEIRLLKPLSQLSVLLSFEIVHVSLKLKPTYAALSYTWGSEGDTRTILLNGRPFKIRQNLHDALQRILDSKLVSKYLWVDAICINQGEESAAKDERSVQITYMKQLYEQATRVLVWLGKPENEINNRLAFALMKKFVRRYLRMALKEEFADFLLTLSLDNDRTVFDLPGSQRYKAWLGLVSLWKSRWWTRTWIYQESTIPESNACLILLRFFALTPIRTKVRFLCGDQEAKWIHFQIAGYAAKGILSAPNIDSRLLVGVLTSAERLNTFRSSRLLDQSSFLELLQMFRHTECTDPRDKVYAPLGLASADVCQYIRPDYTKIVSEVYIDVVRYYLAQSRQKLDFLGYIVYDKDSQIVESPNLKFLLPSWVPNFSASLDIYSIPKILWRAHIIEYPHAYRPLGDTLPRSFIKGNRLCISGVFVDFLKDKASATVGRLTIPNWAAESRNKYFTGESWEDAHKRTIALDIVYDDNGKPVKRGGKIDFDVLRRPRGELSILGYQKQLDMSLVLDRAYKLRCLGQSQNLYLVMVPTTAVVGDEIWALAGGQVFYVLRPVTQERTHYTFIGECYAHGLMDGEIVKRLQSGECRMQDISLI